MLTTLVLLIVVACGYGAYRAIRGGFERPQSERWTGYSIVTAIVLVILALSFASHIFE